MENKTYDINYFIKKFEAIPGELLIEGELGIHANAKCTSGHCDVVSYNAPTIELRCLFFLLQKLKVTFNERHKYAYNHSHVSVEVGFVAMLNDGQSNEYNQPTPKQRILSALYDIKKLSTPSEPKEEKEYRFIEKHSSIKPLLEKEIIYS